ncbi:NPC intracellular cholesterol transporter 2-like [Trichoplusia ni]|uniref:NPC intracellular cholesterol transporter 2-like n=1 Tax=Trichoplusia ni TaxID=7111 RepID=A0A7E5WRR5_TRINI|nr:NPC intracellular cholesterol transporter 2-like [Trichoplusia ni]
MVALRTVVWLCVLAAAAATSVQQCPGQNLENLSDSVQLLSCKKLPCRLKKGTKQEITITFTPEEEIQSVVNQVSAEVFGVPLPFVGVDGQPICDKIFLENGDKASCPLQSGTKYTYKDSFPILDFYPSIPVRVHWALAKKADSKENIICFEVPARIS